MNLVFGEDRVAALASSAREAGGIEDEAEIIEIEVRIGGLPESLRRLS